MNAETPSNGSPDSRSNPAGQSPHEQHSDFGKPQQGPDGAATSSENVNSTIAEPNADQSFLKLLVEAGPLLVFFVANTFGQRFFERGDTQLIFWATGLFMAATVISLTASKILFKRLPVMPFVSGVFVLIFGALTLYFQNELFIKIKPTITNLLFASILGIGLAYGRLFLRLLLGDAFRLTDEGWRILTVRWALFFVFLAILNEAVWRNTSTEFWAGFKFFGVLPITMIFAISQVGILMKHQPR